MADNPWGQGVEKSGDADAEVAVPRKQGGPDDVRDAWRLLAGGAPVAATALIDIAEHGKSEIARVQASTAILDRVGLAPPKEVTFRVQPHEGGETQQLSPAEIVRNRLQELRAGTLAIAAAAVDTEAEQITDAEIVDDDWTGEPEPEPQLAGDGDW